MNSWLPCDKWQHLLGSACIFNLVYLGLCRWRGRTWGTRHVAALVTLACAFLWEIGQLLLGHPADGDMIGDLIADCIGIGVMWRMAV